MVLVVGISPVSCDTELTYRKDKGCAEQYRQNCSVRSMANTPFGGTGAQVLSIPPGRRVLYQGYRAFDMELVRLSGPSISQNLAQRQDTNADFETTGRSPCSYLSTCIAGDTLLRR